jgi:flagellar protein FlaF
MSEHLAHSHTQAASAYGAAAASVDQRALEGQILLKAAQKLEDLASRLKGGEQVDFREVGEILDYNQKLWTLFAADAADPGHSLPQEIKNNIASLAIFVFKRTLDVRADTKAEKLSILITINRNIAAGLMKKAAVPAPAAAPETRERAVTDSVV